LEEKTVISRSGWVLLSEGRRARPGLERHDQERKQGEREVRDIPVEAARRTHGGVKGERGEVSERERRDRGERQCWEWRWRVCAESGGKKSVGGREEDREDIQTLMWTKWDDEDSRAHRSRWKAGVETLKCRWVCFPSFRPPRRWDFEQKGVGVRRSLSRRLCLSR